MTNPQNPILKAHKEGVEMFKKKLGEQTMTGNTLTGMCPDCKFPEVPLKDSDILVKDTFVYKQALDFLTTYGINLLNAAKEAGPENWKMPGNLGQLNEQLKRAAFDSERTWNSCRLS